MDEITAARVAMAIDTDGWITLTRMKNTRGIGLVLTIGLGATNEMIPIWLKSLFGGTTYWRKRPDPNHKDYITWQIHASKAAQILQDILPYLMVKHNQAELAIAFQTAVHAKSSYNEPCTPEYMSRMEAMKLQMGQLNRKGKPSPAETK